MSDFVYNLGSTICGIAEAATRVCHGPADILAAGYFTLLFVAVLLLVWLLLR
jgi:hypothetical protein